MTKQASTVREAIPGSLEDLDLDSIAEPLEAGRRAAAAELARADSALRAVAREHPLATLATAALAGFVLGRVLSRR